jgi:hypothetical protein
MKLAYGLAEYEQVIASFERIMKHTETRNPSEALPIILGHYEATAMNGRHDALRP